MLENFLRKQLSVHRCRLSDIGGPTTTMGTEHLKLDTILSALPESKLRHDGGWLFSPKPLPLDKKTAKALTQLGHPLAQFQKASDSLYQRSVKGKLPHWIHCLLDAGKPHWLIDAQRSPALRDKMPRVIRPDLILTGKDGDDTQSSFALTELDSVPGGMGITLWLSRFYSEHGFDILGGGNGIRDGFQNLFPTEGGRILISDESEDYRPEMEWLAEQCTNIKAHHAEADDGSDSPAYRFFEWFDWQNIPHQKTCCLHQPHFPLQTPPGGKALACPALVTVPQGHLGKRTPQQPPQTAARDRPLWLGRRPRATAPSGCLTPPRRALLGRSSQFQPERTSPGLKNKRLLRTRLGIARCSHRPRHARQRMARADRSRHRSLQRPTQNDAAVSFWKNHHPPLLRPRYRRTTHDARPR